MDRHSEDLNDYNKECNKIWVKEHKGQMILICEKYLRFLNKSESWSGMFSFYDVSLLLNYWIYDKLTQIYGDTNTDDINIGFGALQGKWGLFEPNRRDKSYYKKCKPDHTKVNHEDWKNRKKLYDYYVDYDTLFLGARAIDVLCKKYYKKIKEF
ncbi:variable surface protein Vir32, truncated, putative, partial [Plasmodium vivax]